MRRSGRCWTISGELAFAGLSPDRCCWSAVLHREPDGGVHVHVLAARCDLQTGRSLNIAPPGWLNDYRPLRDMHNLEHGWARSGRPGEAAGFGGTVLRAEAEEGGPAAGKGIRVGPGGHHRPADRGDRGRPHRRPGGRRPPPVGARRDHEAGQQSHQREAARRGSRNPPEGSDL